MQLLEIASYTDDVHLLETCHLVSLMEMHFSNKDLQDPDTVKKILNQKHTFVTIEKYVVAIIGIILMIVSLPTIVGPMVIGCLWVSIYTTLSAYPAKKNDKTLQRLKAACQKLKDSTQSKMERHPDKKSQLQDVIKNCDKVLSEIYKIEKKSSDERFEKEVKHAVDIYNDLSGFIKYPNALMEYPDFCDMIELAKMIGISEQYLMDRIKKCDPDSKDRDEVVGWLKDEYSHISLKDIEPELSGNGNIIEIVRDDQFSIICSTKSGSVYYVDHQGLKKTTLFKENKHSDLPSKDALIEADKRLGYYRLSKCPDAVIPKKLEI